MAHAGSGRTAGQRGQALRQPAALCGLGAGSMIALAAIAIKFATVKLAGVDTVGSALVSLVVVMTIQSVMHLAMNVARDRGTLLADVRPWRTYTRVGQTGTPCIRVNVCQLVKIMVFTLTFFKKRK